MSHSRVPLPGMHAANFFLRRSPVKHAAALQVAYLNQEFDIHAGRTVREELASAFKEGLANQGRSEAIQKELEECYEDMDRMSELLDELNKLSGEAQDLDMAKVDGKIDKMMPELGFSPTDNDRQATAGAPFEF